MQLCAGITLGAEANRLLNVLSKPLNLGDYLVVVLSLHSQEPSADGIDTVTLQPALVAHPA